MKLFIHPVRIRYYDYTEYLSDGFGVAWSTNNEQGQALGLGIEWCADWKAVRAKITAWLSDDTCPSSLELAEGLPIVTRSNMNPRGDI